MLELVIQTQAIIMTTSYFASSSIQEKLNSLLIIEKDEIQRKGLIIALMDLFAEIRLTNNPHEAIELVKIRQFNVIISESDFDVISVREFIMNIVKYNPEALLIIISSRLNEDAKTELRNSGAQMIFDKPIDIKELINDIKTYKNNKEYKK
jgi:DNA-binding NtrC family response regulator